MKSIDSTPLDLATIAVTNPSDSTLITYSVTNKKGDFLLTNLPAGKPLEMLISFVGYQTVKKNIFLKSQENIDVGEVRLSEMMLEEVQILSTRPPITIRNDTIEYNTQYFKTRPNALLEELLKKLPGIQVDLDGTIYVNGKIITKIRLNGREFFGSNPKALSKNLDAEMVEKVLILDDRETDPDHLISIAKVGKIIDLRLKKKYRKGMFGKLGLGGGTKERYGLGGLVNVFQDTLQVSFLGLRNNLNNSSFSRNDLNTFGGFGRGGSEALQNGSLSTGGGVFNSIQDIMSTGFNLNNDFNNELKVNMTYYYNKSTDIYHTNSILEQFLNGPVLISNSLNDRRESIAQHSVNGLIKWTPDKSTQIRYSPLLNFHVNDIKSSLEGRTISSSDSLLNTSMNIGNERYRKVSFSHSLFYYRSFKKPGSSLTITHNLSVTPGSGENYFDNRLISFTMLNPSDTIDRVRISEDDNKEGGVNVTYRFTPSKKTAIDISLDNQYRVSDQQFATYEKDINTNGYTVLLPGESSQLKRAQLTHNIRPQVEYKINESWSIFSSLSLQLQHFRDRFYRNSARSTQTYVYLLPAAELRGKMLSLNYNMSINFPSIADLQPFTYVRSPLYLVAGNPELKPFSLQNFELNYYNYLQKSSISIQSFARLSVPHNSIITSQIVDADGKTFSKPVNAEGNKNYNVSYGGGFSKQFKKISNIQISLSSSLNGSFDKNFFIVNNSGYTNVFSIKVRQGFSVNWKDKVDFSPMYVFSKSITSYTDSAFPDNNSTTQSFVNKVTYYITKKFDIEGTFSHLNNRHFIRSFNNNLNLLDVSLSLQIQKKERGVIKFSVYDIFNQNKSVLRYAYENKIINSQNRILGRYLFVQYSIRLNK